MPDTRQRGLVGLFLLVVVLLCALVSGGWFLYQWLDTPDIALANKATTSQEDIPQKHTAPAVSDIQPEIPKNQISPISPESAKDAELAAMRAGFDLSQIGKTPWSDQEFRKLTALLNSNPDVISYLALEYRISQDRKTIRRLAQLLGRFDAEVITDVGVELALSGEVGSQRSGLLLLGKQQPRVQRARDTIAEVLTVESRPEVLTAALNAMAKPADVPAEEHRDLLNRYTHLTENADPTVRALSVSVIAVWSGETDMSNVLLGALEDADPMVRENAAFAFLKSRHLGDEAKLALFARVEDSTEVKRTREAALYALQRFNLTEADKARYEQGKSAVQRALNY